MSDVKKDTHLLKTDSDKKLPETIDHDVKMNLRKEVEPWLSAIFQSEHLNLLVGSGLTRGVSSMLGLKAEDMGRLIFSYRGELIKKRAEESAQKSGRKPNFEDDLRAANELLEGLRILDDEEQFPAGDLEDEINQKLTDFISQISKDEDAILAKFSEKRDVENCLISFLMSFASRMPSRERLNIFTTNYDRLIEYACDEAGVRVLDRFAGALEPRFRASRLNVDMHYNPPGIRGEPRYLED